MIYVIDASSEVDFARHAMNFTPRSVAMGNSMTKAYKLHVKFESGGKKYEIQRVERNTQNKTHVNDSTGKETFSCMPDTSVGQLKGKIGAKFQVVTPGYFG